MASRDYYFVSSAPASWAGAQRASVVREGGGGHLFECPRRIGGSSTCLGNNTFAVGYSDELCARCDNAEPPFFYRAPAGERALAPTSDCNTRADQLPWTLRTRIAPLRSHGPMAPGDCVTCDEAVNWQLIAFVVILVVSVFIIVRWGATIAEAQKDIEGFASLLTFMQVLALRPVLSAL